MKERKQICPWGLIWEGFRQCRFLGILCLVIMVFGAAAVPFAGWINREYELENTVSIVCSSPSSNPLLLVLIPAAPLMTWILFHFLDSRVGSDFYLALPYRRLTMYLCFIASILLWMGLLLVSSVAVSLIACNLIPYTVVLYDGMLSYVGSILVTMLLLMAGVLVGMGLSGTIFTNILLSGIILFLPRLCCFLLSNAVTSSIPFFVSGEEGQSFFRNSNNLVYAWMSSCLGLDDWVVNTYPTHPGWQALLYTFLLALIYFAIGAWLFHRRRSETAGQAAPNRLFQHVYRILVTMSFTLVVSCSLYVRMEDSTSAADDWFTYLILYLIAVLIYCAYELITTRKWKNLLYAMPGLAIVAVLNGGALLGMHVAYREILADRPSAQEIKSVSFRKGQTTHDGLSLYYTDYVDLNTQEVQITDSTVLSLVSYYLNENIQTYEASPENYLEKYQVQTYSSSIYFDEDGYTYESSGNQNTQSYQEYVVTIRTDRDVIDRLVYIPMEESQEIQGILKKNQEYVSAWTTLPDPVEGTLNFDQETELTNEETEQLFESYREELQEVTDLEALSEAATDLTDVHVFFDYSFQRNGQSISLNCPLMPTILPKTTALYYQYQYQEQAQAREVLERVLAGECTASVYVTITGGYASAEAAGYNMYSYDCLETDLSQDLEVLQTLEGYLKDAAVSSGSSYAELTIYMASDGSEEMTEEYFLRLPVSDAVFEDQTLIRYFEGDFLLD